MTRATTTIAIGLLAASLAACSKPAATTQTATPEPMSGLQMPAAAKAGHATGVVTAIDTASGKITLDHGPVEELQWPAMKMAFGASPQQIHGIAVGDKVAFKFTVTGTSAQITDITKQ